MARPGRGGIGSASAAMLAFLVAAAAPSTAAVRPPDPPRALHATRGAEAGIFDSRGREVLLRGVNVNQLADYYRGNPDWETVVPLRRHDFRRIARIGFNSVRLLMSWSRLEPRPGAFNRRYVSKLRRAVGWASELGLHVVLDMHQDAWGKHISTPPGEECLPGASPAVGWDGAPRWATFTDGAPTCRFSIRELSPAVGQAWQAFHTDRNGIQTRLVETWGRVARAFADEPAVAGWDLLNEPNPGLAPVANDLATLTSFYARAIREIRAAEASKPGGFEHIVFFEPPALWSATSIYPTLPPDLSGEESLVFAPHLYAETFSPFSIEQGFDLAAVVADLFGVTVWSGEWGFYAREPVADAGRMRRYAAAEDGRGWGGAWWSWKQACGDPHVVRSPGAEPARLSPSLNRYDCTGSGGVGRPLGIPRIYRDVLSRPVPRAVPGRLLGLRSSGEELTMELRGRSEGERCGLRVFVPARAGRPRIHGDGVSEVRLRRVLGDWSVRACVEGTYRLALAPRA